MYAARYSGGRLVDHDAEERSIQAERERGSPPPRTSRKILQQPVVSMIGGQVGSIRVYGSSMKRDIAPKDEAVRFKILQDEKGINAFKYRIGAECGNGNDEWEGRSEEIIKTINKELNFASHLAFYPPCFIDPENTDFTKSPIHIFIGELDNWTPAKPCEDLASKLKPNTNIDVTVFKSSYHSFDTCLLYTSPSPRD